MKRKQTDIQDFALVKKSYSSTPNKEKMIREKKNAQSLSGQKLVYAHDEEPDNTMILRSFYPDSSEELRRYGIRGEENIESLFLGILHLIGETEKEEIKKKSRYVTAVQINALYELVDEMKKRINKQGFSIRSKEALILL